MSSSSNKTELPLKDILLKRIAATGPITIAEYMTECLMHPQYGYYQQEKVFGAEGDFITAPEVSQMFGEMLGLWLADRWYKMGKPEGTHLIELGPGRGTLMSDILRATGAVEGFHSALTIHFVEASEQLRAKQAELVPHANWHDSIDSVPDGPSLIIANEFFDALPVQQFEKQKDTWLERRINAEGEDFTIVLTPPSPQLALLDPALKQGGHEGSILEVCPAGLTIAGTIAERLERADGAALIIDYGYKKSNYGETFQALEKHQFTNPLDRPGKADLTAHVAFDQIEKAAKSKNAAVYGPASQGMFLMGLGIGARAQQLAEHVGNEETSARILAELKRLTAGDEMGTLFKVLAIQNSKLAPAAGF